MQQQNDPDQFPCGVGPASWEAGQIMKENLNLPRVQMQRKPRLNPF